MKSCQFTSTGVALREPKYSAQKTKLRYTFTQHKSDVMVEEKGIPMLDIKHLTTEELEAGLDLVRQSPRDTGTLEMIVRRPQTETREEIKNGELDLIEGLIGDNWRARGSGGTADRSANFDAQLTVMNSRLIALVAQDKERWQLAGDQLFVDFDISAENLPPGTRLSIGKAIIEVSALPHTGCKKFVARFGMDAMLFVNSPLGKELHLRGINTRIVQPGKIRVGDVVRKM
jgi:MOSC domain-containing protein